jgi:hypothetical protein
MSKQYFKRLFILFSVVIVASSCYKEPDFSLTPEIEFYDITSEVRLDQATGGVKDSVVVTIKFQDGDGDLGVNTEATTEYFKKFGYNYNVKMFREKNGKFEEVINEVALSGFFPVLSTDKPGPLEGKLSYRMPAFFHDFWIKKDKVKFLITIKDRAGNQSNEIETDTIILNNL